jgi:carboxyl-terminal processing protease
VVPDIQVLQDVPDELKGRVDTKGEASMRGHLSAEGTEQTGSQAYVPPDEKNDKALAAALDTLRGVTVKADNPAPAKTVVPN